MVQSADCKDAPLEAWSVVVRESLWNNSLKSYSGHLNKVKCKKIYEAKKSMVDEPLKGAYNQKMVYSNLLQGQS